MITDTKTCRHCQADLRAGEISDRPGEYYSRLIGVEIQGVYDGMLYYQCPDCGGRWHRFPEGHYLRARAAPYVDTPPLIDAHEG